MKALVRKVGQLLRMSEAEILSDSQDVSLIASNIDKAGRIFYLAYFL